jgi:hypothetical protein
MWCGDSSSIDRLTDAIRFVGRLFAFTRNHFSDVLITPNFAFSAVPTPLAAEMIASAIPAAISPYSHPCPCSARADRSADNREPTSAVRSRLRASAA